MEDREDAGALEVRRRMDRSGIACRYTNIDDRSATGVGTNAPSLKRY